MQTSFAIKLLFTGLICVLTVGLAAGAGAAEKPAKQASAKEKKGTLYHVVSFKFKPDATPDQIKKVEDAFAGLKKKIHQIQTYEWGTNVSPEKHDKGFTHCFVLTFKTAKDRDDYLVHPDHKAFGGVVGPVLADVFVVDFWAEK